jgi:hypothetical protein
MASNSIAPSGKAVELYLDGSDWKVALYADDGTTQIASVNIGAVEIDADSIVAIPLDLRAMSGDAANELRIFGAGVIKVRHVEPLNSSFPIAGLTVANGEVPGQQFATIEAIGSGITRVRIAWGAKS